MPEPTIKRLAEKLPGLKLMNTYGATETSSPSTTMPAELAATRLANVGLPVPNCRIIIVDDRGVELPRGEAGEIWIAGPSVVKGYWNRPDADAGSLLDIRTAAISAAWTRTASSTCSTARRT